MGWLRIKILVIVTEGLYKQTEFIAQRASDMSINGITVCITKKLVLVLQV